MHIDFNVTEYLEKLQKKGFTDSQAIEMLKEEQDRFQLIEKAIEESKKEIKSEIEAKQLATKDDIEIAQLKLEKEIVATREGLQKEIQANSEEIQVVKLELQKEIEKLRADIVDKINSSNRWVIGTIIIGLLLVSLPRIIDAINK